MGRCEWGESNKSELRLADVLSNPPQHVARINDHEIPDSPLPISSRPNTHTILGGQAQRPDMVPPRFHVLDQQMHHEVVWRFLEVLQEKACIAMPNIREII